MWSFAWIGPEANIDLVAWLIEEGYDVICFMAAIGQEEDFKAAREKALKIGAKECYIENLNDEFVKELCFPAIQCNAIYENVYLLGTSLARPVIARAQIAVAQKEKCQFTAHGATVRSFLIRVGRDSHPAAPFVMVSAKQRLCLTVLRITCSFPTRLNCHYSDSY